MQIEGTLQAKLPITTYGKDNKKKGGFVINFTEFNRPKQVAFTVFEKQLPSVEALNNGDVVKVDFSVESREYNGKYYTDATAYKIEVVSAARVKDTAPKPTEVIESKYDSNLPF